MMLALELIWTVLIFVAVYSRLLLDDWIFLMLGMCLRVTVLRLDVGSVILTTLSRLSRSVFGLTTAISSVMPSSGPLSVNP